MSREIVAITLHNGTVYRVDEKDVTSITWTVDRRWGINYFFYTVMFDDGSLTEVYTEAVATVHKK